MANKFNSANLIELINNMGFKAFNNGDAILCVSAENGDDAADYNGVGRGGYAWINPKLVAFAEKRDCFWEWQNPGCIALYQ